MCFRDLGSQCYLFQFFHEKDVGCVERGEPWSFDRHVLITCRLGPNEQPSTCLIFDLSMWLQIYDLPASFHSEKVCFAVGNYVGKYMESDVRNFNGYWKEFVRVRVLVDIRMPLKDHMKIKNSGGDWIALKFQYELLPSFFFLWTY